jgi:chromosome segregation ATPase
MGTDLKSATLQVAKALDDPARGLTALRRSGVSFTKQQQEMIVGMSEAGQQAEAQRAILKRLEEQVGGAGAGAAGGLAGATDTLKERWTELLEEFNRTADSSSVVQSAIGGITGAVEGATEMLRNRGLPDVTDAEARRVAVAEKVAVLEQQILEAQNNGPIAVAMLTKELEGAREELIGIFKEFDRANEIDQMADSMHFVRMEAKTMAAEQAKQNSEDEARTKLLEDYEKKLGEVRKALGSTTLKHQEQAAQLALLEFAYEQGAIKLDEFLELQNKLNEASKRTQGGVIDFFPGFVAPQPVSRGAGPGSSAPVRVVPNEEEKKQTGILYKIEKHLANGQTVAVTV